jgi:hypothetical protein
VAEEEEPDTPQTPKKMRRQFSDVEDIGKYVYCNRFPIEHFIKSNIKSIHKNIIYNASLNGENIYYNLIFCPKKHERIPKFIQLFNETRYRIFIPPSANIDCVVLGHLTFHCNSDRRDKDSVFHFKLNTNQEYTMKFIANPDLSITTYISDKAVVDITRDRTSDFDQVFPPMDRRYKIMHKLSDFCKNLMKEILSHYEENKGKK